MSFTYHRSVFDEVESATRWYSERDRIAANKFSHAITRTLQRIEEWPQSAPLIGFGFRALKLSQNFPYQIIYQVRQDSIHIIAIAHFKRQPQFWAKRLES